MRKRNWFALALFSIFIFNEAKAEITPAEAGAHDPSVDGFRQFSPSGGGGSIYGKDAACKTGRSRGGVGGGGGGYTPPPNLGALGSNAGGNAGASTPATPEAPKEEVENFSENPGILDVQAFITKRCTSCHKDTEAKMNAENKIRVVKGGKEYTLAQALDAVNKNPAMDKVRSNPNVMKALETWKNLP